MECSLSTGCREISAKLSNDITANHFRAATQRLRSTAPSFTPTLGFAFSFGKIPAGWVVLCLLLALRHVLGIYGTTACVEKALRETAMWPCIWLPASRNSGAGIFSGAEPLRRNHFSENKPVLSENRRTSETFLPPECLLNAARQWSNFSFLHFFLGAYRAFPSNQIKRNNKTTRDDTADETRFPIKQTNKTGTPTQAWAKTNQVSQALQEDVRRTDDDFRIIWWTERVHSLRTQMNFIKIWWNWGHRDGTWRNVRAKLPYFLTLMSLAKLCASKRRLIN